MFTNNFFPMPMRLLELCVLLALHVDVVGAISKVSSSLIRNEQIVAFSPDKQTESLSQVSYSIRRSIDWPGISLPPQKPAPDSFLMNAKPISGGNIVCKQHLSQPDWSWNLPRLAAAREAASVMSKVVGQSACSHLTSDVAKQFDSLVSGDDLVWAWTVADQAYGNWVADWALQVHSIGAQKILVVSIDQEPRWTRSLCEQGIPVIDFTLQGRIDATVADAKFKIPAHFIRQQVTNMFVEMDIFWPLAGSLNLDKILKQTNGSHLVLGTTSAAGYDEINIGFWLCKHDAPSSVAVFFEHVLGLKEWDQAAFNQVVKKAIKVKTYDGKEFARSDIDTCDFSMKMCKIMSEVRIGLLSSIVQNGYFGVDTRRKFQDQFPIGVHVWSYDGHLKGSLGKLAVAKNAGFFFGAGCYYEQCNSGEQYVAWDGVLHEGEGAREAMEVLLAAAWATNRSLILPQVQGSSGIFGFAEAMFRLIYPKVRESNFLYNPRLHSTALYPIVQLSVHEKGWASVRTVHGKGNDVITYFKDKEGNAPGSVARMLSALLQQEDVASAKMLLISVGLGGAGYYLPSFDVTSCGGSIPDIVRRVKRCKKAVAEHITASDIC